MHDVEYDYKADPLADGSYM